MPVDSETMQVVFALSSETGIPFLIHHEAEDSLFPELERMLVKYPKAKVVWCHVGRNRNTGTWKRFRNPDGVREMILKYPNLYFDLVQSKPGATYHKTEYVDAIMYDLTVMEQKKGRGKKNKSGAGMMSNSSLTVYSLDDAWKKLFEEFPDRFVIGSDINTGRFDTYDRVIDTFRSVVLKDLRKDVAEKMAFKNAWKLMTSEDWKD